MYKADKYFIDTIKDIQENGIWSVKPRTVWEDGTVAHYKSLKLRSYVYDISKGEFPIQSFRRTPFKGCFEEIRWIYQLQSNVIKEADKSIWSWWDKFEVSDGNIGETYGHTVRKHNLLNKLLYGLETNPDGRRHILDLWREEQTENKALPPCAFLTLWSIERRGEINFLNLNLIQRSQDYLITASINPTEYLILAYMVASHLTFVTGIEHQVGVLKHDVNDVHIYDRHFEAVEEILNKTSLEECPRIAYIGIPKNFYDIRWADFKVFGAEKISNINTKLEIAI